MKRCDKMSEANFVIDDRNNNIKCWAKNIHRPQHLYINNQIYFITGRTYRNIKHFNSTEKKDLLCKIINESSDRFQISIYAWAVLDNHYHLLIGLFGNNNNEFHSNQRFEFNSSHHEVNYYNKKTKNSLIEFIRKIHKDSARNINNIDKVKNRRIWYQYWDRIVRSEKNFYSYINYIHLNPIKHRKINYFGNLKRYKHSSYLQYLKRYGPEWINECFEKYMTNN